MVQHPDKHDFYNFEILKHVENTPELNNRIAAAKLGCSVKLAHTLLQKLVSRGLLHVKKRNARKWDYFLTPKGVIEKARLTYEFLDFSIQFYREARKLSSKLCKDIASAGKFNIGFIGANDLAEIVYLGVKEWNLTLKEIFDDEEKNFLGYQVKPISEIHDSVSDVLIVCLYDKKNPMKKHYLPINTNIVPQDKKLLWIF